MEDIGATCAYSAGPSNVFPSPSSTCADNITSSVRSNQEFDIVTLHLSTLHDPDTMDRRVGEYIKPEPTKIPLVSQSIPLMDGLMVILSDAAANTTLHATVRSAAMRASLLMTKYRRLNEESWIFGIAMGELSF